MKIALFGASGKMGRAIAAIQAPVPLDQADVLIDFSSPEGTQKALALALARNLPLVSGTTNLPKEIFAEASKTIPIFHAPNFAPGIAALTSLLPHIPGAPHITEVHHTEKKDSPSGTALLLQSLLPEAKITAHRIPDAIGTHTITFALDDEEITVTHTTTSRRPFALGALRAAAWLQDKPPGLYAQIFQAECPGTAV